MIGELLGALVGREIDKSDGQGGTAGAVLGVAAEVVLKKALPLVLLGAGLLIAGHYVKKWGESA